MSSPTPPVPPPDERAAHPSDVGTAGGAVPPAVADAAAGPAAPDAPGPAALDAPVPAAAAAPGAPVPAAPGSPGTPWWSAAALVLAGVTLVAALGTLVPGVGAPNVLGPVAIVLAVVGRRRGEGRIARTALWTSVGAVALQLLVPVLAWVGLALWSANAS